MDLDIAIYERFRRTAWFSKCGDSTLASGHIVLLASIEEAVKSVTSSEWEDAGTEAQGDLTGYLSKTRPEVYGGHWNRLAKESRSKLEMEIVPLLTKALPIGLQSESVIKRVTLDLNRIALFSTYKRRVCGVPSFFEELYAIYEQGRFPCGWEGDLDKWPSGRFVAY